MSVRNSNNKSDAGWALGDVTDRSEQSKFELLNFEDFTLDKALPRRFKRQRPPFEHPGVQESRVVGQADAFEMKTAGMCFEWFFRITQSPYGQVSLFFFERLWYNVSNRFHGSFVLEEISPRYNGVLWMDTLRTGQTNNRRGSVLLAL